MTDKILQLTGDKYSGMIIDVASLKFAKNTATTTEEFKQQFEKSTILDTKTEIRFDQIQSIVKEDNDNTIKIKYQKSIGIPASFEFSFSSSTDVSGLFDYFESQRGYVKTKEKLTPLKSSISALWPLLLTMALTYFYYQEALDIENGTDGKAYGAKAKISKFVAETLGTKGVLVVGVLLCVLFMYFTWSRFSNPPYITKLEPSTQKP